MSMGRTLYSLLLYLLAPFAVARLLWRSRELPAYRERMAERFGYVSSQREGGIWVHAVSVGEAQSVEPLVRALIDRYPGRRVIMTTTTPTGAQRVASLFADQVTHLYMPYDLPDVIARFLARVRPVMVLVVETEIWPNLIAACDRRGIPLAMINARMTAPAMVRYRRWAGSLVRRTLQRIDPIAAQSEPDRQRFEVLGARPAQLEVMGNLKFDLQVPATVKEQGEHLRQQWGGPRPIWVAASTHKDEEDILVRVHRRVLELVPNALMIVVPRHPERFAEVEHLLRREFGQLAKRSGGGSPRRQDAVYLVDTMGELPVFYAVADVAFVGGSLVPAGGHNALEPAALGLATLIGPHVFNCQTIVDGLRATGGLTVSDDEAEIAGLIGAWLGDPVTRNEAGDRNREFVASNQGALGHALAIVGRHVGGETSD